MPERNEFVCIPAAIDPLAPVLFLVSVVTPGKQTPNTFLGNTFTVQQKQSAISIFSVCDKKQTDDNRYLSVLFFFDFSECFHEIVEARILLVLVLAEQRHRAIQREKV